MPNLTFEKKLVKDAPDVNPVIGHSLVVFERRGEGRKFVAVVDAEKEFQEKRPGWLTRWLSDQPDYDAYAVNMDQSLDLEFTRRVGLKSQVKAIDVTFKVKYCVANAKDIVTRLLTDTDQDPLTRLQKAIGDGISSAISDANWDMIRGKGFDTVAGGAIGSAREEINTFAEYLGLAVKSLSLSRRLLEKDIEIELLEEEAKRERERRDLDHQGAIHKVILSNEVKKTVKVGERELKTMDLETDIALLAQQDEVHSARIRMQVRQKGADAIGKALDGVASGIDSATALGDAIKQVQSIMSIPAGPQALPGKPVLELTAHRSDGAGRLVDLLNKALNIISEIDCEKDERKALLSSLLHLIAELVAGDAGDEQEVELYGDRFKDAVAALALPLEQYNSLVVFLNYGAVKELLK